MASSFSALASSANLLPLSFPTSTRLFLTSSFHLPSPRRDRGFVISRAKFEKFDGVPVVEDDPEKLQREEDVEDSEEDSDLPSDLVDAIQQSGRASADFVSAGGMRAIVELLIPQMQFLDAEGAQAELWELSKIFLDTLMEETGVQKLKAIFPDAGASALLKFQWKGAGFGFASLSDRNPVSTDDELVVMILPDYQMLEYVEKIALRLSDDPPRPLIMWNPRLVSEDVGVGFNVRKLRRNFLSTFTPVYSMRPLPDGAVFRCYPGMWKVFYDDKDRPNRYRLAKEQPSRPDATDLEIIFGGVAEKSGEEPSLLSKVGGVFSSISRFMKAIS